MVCPGPGDWGSEWASFRSSVEAATTCRAQGLGRKTKNSGRSARGEEESGRGLTPFPAWGPPNIFSTTSTCHCPFVPLPYCPPPTPMSPYTPNSSSTHPATTQTPTYTHTHTLWEPAATSAVIPPDFRCLTGRRQGGWGQQAVNTGRDRKSLRTLPLWIFDERECGLVGALPLVKSEHSVCGVCMTANRGWDKQGLDRAQTTANPCSREHLSWQLVPVLPVHVAGKLCW